MEENKKDVLILAIETSCDETAAAVVKNGREVLSNTIYTQIKLHTLFGGVVPEIASRKHIEKINIVIETALKEAGVSLEDIQTQYPYVTDWHTYSFTNETEKSDLLSHADIVSQASSMNTGDVSEPFLDGTYPCIIKVTRKEDATVIPLAEVRNRITDYLLNSRISTETELIQNRLVFTETDAFQNTSIE